jgi:hypothetical membrane protein
MGRHENSGRILDLVTRTLALGAVVGPVVFVVSFTVAGWLRAGYSPVRQAISALGIGPNGLLERLPAMVAGLLIALFAVAFAAHADATLVPPVRWLGGALLALPGLGLAASGVFSAARPTVAIHSAVSTMGLVGALGAFTVMGAGLQRDMRWRALSRYSLAAGAATLVLIVVEFLAANPHAPLAQVPIGGLVERVLVIEVLAWYVVFGLRLAARPATLAASIDVNAVVSAEEPRRRDGK